jgi:ribosomal protein S6
MSETKMPAVEASTEVNEREPANYELAFHVLPTVAEGEVTKVFQALKDIISSHGGEVTTEEEPARFELAYEIIKHLEGRNRKFTSAYFGWVRFNVEPATIEAISQDVEGVSELLRHILIKLTKTEEVNPFLFHEALEEKMVENIEVDEVTAVAEPEVKKEKTEKTEEPVKEEEPAVVGEESVDKV